jgi:CheY-like chemotaxis protein
MVPVGVVSQKPQTRRQISRALSSGGLSVHFVDDATALEHLRREHDVQLVIADSDLAAAEDIARVLSWIEKSGTPVPVVLLSIGENKAPLIELFRLRDVVNVVAKHGAVRAIYPMLDERELLVTVQKVLQRDIFGVHKYIGAWGTAVHEGVLTRMADKATELEGLDRFLQALGCPAGVIPDILNVADEFLLNAIVHAPSNEDGSSKYREIGPVADLVLAPNEHVRFTYGCDGQRFMLGVSDNFGRLERGTLYKYVSKGFGEEKLTPEDKISGAGLGLTLAFRSIHQLVFNIQVGERTECIAGWYLRVANAREFRQVGKSFNVFWLPKGVRPTGAPVL